MMDHLFEVRGAKEAADGRLAEAIASGHWDMPDVAEAKIHRIHAYPAKFPAFLATRALAYARDEGLTVRRVGDIFCGCGTVAFEATQAGLDFWGCDINPVATLIAQVKGSYFRPERLKDYARQILEASSSASTKRPLALEAEERLRHWFQPQQFDNLARLLNAIETVVSSRSRYRKVFLCAFSAILKATSQWRQRSTKPALDLAKKPSEVGAAFARQVDLMMRAWSELSPSAAVVPDVQRGNVLTIAPPAKLDMIITSPPYVTSYEYADLHQLSALWLGFAADYRTLREGSVGTAQHRLNFRREFGRLNRAGFQIVFSLFNHDPLAARAVANYYLDMQDVARRCKEFLSRNGMALFVIGNTQYSGVNVDNAAHLAEALFDAGFKRVRVTKRRISNKLHTPFRMADGRFSRSAREKQIYSEEYIVIGHR
jgi:methylase of polypeptide subunit release factors